MCLGEIDAGVRTLEGHPHGVLVLQYSNERDMLLAWHEMAMRRCDVDELVTYNGLFYDELWLLDRAKMLGISQVTSRMSKFCDFAVEAKKIQTTSNQSGDRVEYRIKMPGRSAATS
jgi:DNA polymerase elongation subunit (family B)